MADVKIGMNQVGKPAPLSYRRFENAWVLIFAPSIGGFGITLGLSGKGAAIFSASIILVTAMIKGFGMILGNGQVYAPTNETVDNQSATTVVKMLILALGLSMIASTSHAQEGCNLSKLEDSAKYVAAGVWQWSVPELKEAAKGCYFKVLDIVNGVDTFSKVKFEVALNQYEYWRKLVDLKLSNKKDREDFHNWIAAEARAAGKVTYDQKKS